jgi:hypothetical protein
MGTWHRRTLRRRAWHKDSRVRRMEPVPRVGICRPGRHGDRHAGVPAAAGCGGSTGATRPAVGGPGGEGDAVR